MLTQQLQGQRKQIFIGWAKINWELLRHKDILYSMPQMQYQIHNAAKLMHRTMTKDKRYYNCFNPIAIGPCKAANQPSAVFTFPTSTFQDKRKCFWHDL